MSGDRIQRWHMRRGAPRHACMRCFRQDTDTFFVVYGDAEWTAAAISAFAGLDTDEAIRTTETMRGEHGTKPDERVTSFIRLCSACAEKNHNPVLYTTAEIEQAQREGGALSAVNQADA